MSHVTCLVFATTAEYHKALEADGKRYLSPSTEVVDPLRRILAAATPKLLVERAAIPKFHFSERRKYAPGLGEGPMGNSGGSAR
jgi:hypothetical protein